MLPGLPTKEQHQSGPSPGQAERRAGGARAKQGTGRAWLPGSCPRLR